MYWKHVGLTDVRARLLADRHYSRQHPGTPCFTPPGNNIILLGLNDDALWVSHRPDPRAMLEMPRRDGFLYWDNPYFRNESGRVASELIIQALQVTMYLWQDEIPRDGFHSFIDPKKVKPMMRRGRETWGYTYEKAGFSLYPMRTKERNLLRYVLGAQQLRAIEPQAPLYEQMAMFA